MLPVFALKQHNTGPDLRVTLKGSDGRVQDLTGATVRFSMAWQKTGVSVISNVLGAVDGDPTLGGALYHWQAADTAEVGLFRAEFEITLPNGQLVSFPGGDYITVQVLPASS